MRYRGCVKAVAKTCGGEPKIAQIHPSSWMRNKLCPAVR